MLVVSMLLIGAAVATNVDVAVSPSSFKGEGAWVTASWSNWPAKISTDECFVAVFPVPNPNVSAISPQDYPATAPWIATAPSQWIMCSQDPGFNGSGNGSIGLYVVNGRDDLAIGVFAGGIDKPSLVSNLAVVTAESQEEYQNVHISRWKNADEMMVVFTSKYNNGTAAVRWGLSAAGPFDNLVYADSATYQRSDLCGGPAVGFGWHEPGWFHSALLTGLPEAGTTVYYQYGDPTSWSSTMSFQAPLGADPSKTVGVLITADQGVTVRNDANEHWSEPSAYRTVEGIRQLKDANSDLFQWWVLVGDVSYATGIETKWDYFMNSIYNMSDVPFNLGHGNHEDDWTTNVPTYYKDADSGGECSIPTKHRFPQPGPEMGMTWYSVEYGPIHWTMYNTELPMDPDTEQYSFLEADLAAVDRTKTPWLIVSGHRPMYTGTSRDDHLSVIEPLLYKNKVDFNFVGHVHNAQLFCPMYNGTCTDGAPVHAVIGNAGQSLSPFPALDNRTIFSFEGWGYNALYANATSLTLSFFANSNHSLLFEKTYTK